MTARDLKSPSAELLSNDIDDIDAIESWLTVFARLMRLSDSRKQAICAELHEHLRERVRDLMLAGHSETQSIQHAIEELGETAHLAQRFESANRTKQRRLFMNLAIIGVAAGALTVGIVATQSAPRTASVFESKAPNSVVVTDAKLNIETNATLGTIIESIPQQTAMGLSIDWALLDQLGFAKDSPAGISGKDIPVQRVLELIAERRSPGGDHVDWRFDGRTLIIGTTRSFDIKESVLACYALGEAIGPIAAFGGCSSEEAAEKIHQLVQSLVEPENWRDNGGDLAAIYIVGDRMFVQAPPRMQKRVEWILQQLNAGGEVKADGQSKAEKIPVLKDVPIIDQFFTPGATSAVPPATFSPGAGINIEIFNLIEQGQWYKAARSVDAEGNIRLPMLGDVHVAGMKPGEVEQVIKDRLKTDGILENAVMTVYGSSGPPRMGSAEPNANSSAVSAR